MCFGLLLLQRASRPYPKAHARHLGGCTHFGSLTGKSRWTVWSLVAVNRMKSNKSLNLEMMFHFKHLQTTLCSSHAKPVQSWMRPNGRLRRWNCSPKGCRTLRRLIFCYCVIALACAGCPSLIFQQRQSEPNCTSTEVVICDRKASSKCSKIPNSIAVLGFAPSCAFTSPDAPNWSMSCLKASSFDTGRKKSMGEHTGSTEKWQHDAVKAERDRKPGCDSAATEQAHVGLDQWGNMNIIQRK